MSTSLADSAGVWQVAHPVVANRDWPAPCCGPTRVGYKFEGDTKVRVCKKCGQAIAPKGKK